MATFMLKPPDYDEHIPGQFYADFKAGEDDLMQTYIDWLVAHDCKPMIPWYETSEKRCPATVSCWAFDDDVIFAHKIAWE